MFSRLENKKIPLLLVISIFLQSFSFLSIKYSTLNEGISTLLLLTLAFIFFGSRVVVWQILLKSLELSKVYPFTSLVQILILMYSAILFNEDITANNIFGVFIMISGVFYMSKGSKS